MTLEDVRAVFIAAEANATTPEERSRTQLLKEYFTSPVFRAQFENYVFALNNPNAAIPLFPRRKP